MLKRHRNPVLTMSSRGKTWRNWGCHNFLDPTKMEEEKKARTIWSYEALGFSLHDLRPVNEKQMSVASNSTWSFGPRFALLFSNLWEEAWRTWIWHESNLGLKPNLKGYGSSSLSHLVHTAEGPLAQPSFWLVCPFLPTKALACHKSHKSYRSGYCIKCGTQKVGWVCHFSKQTNLVGSQILKFHRKPYCRIVDGSINPSCCWKSGI